MKKVFMLFLVFFTVVPFLTTNVNANELSHEHDCSTHVSISSYSTVNEWYQKGEYKYFTFGLGNVLQWENGVRISTLFDLTTPPTFNKYTSASGSVISGYGSEKLQYFDNGVWKNLFDGQTTMQISEEYLDVFYACGRQNVTSLTFGLRFFVPHTHQYYYNGVSQRTGHETSCSCGKIVLAAHRIINQSSTTCYVCDRSISDGGDFPIGVIS